MIRARLLRPRHVIGGCLLRPGAGALRWQTGPRRTTRKAFVMSVDAGKEEEYEARHRPIWPELEDTLKKHGVVDYSIFLLPSTRQLFAYAEIEDEAQWEAIAETDVCQKWWAHMGDVMPSNPDGSPVAVDLKEVFHIDSWDDLDNSTST